jgi:predicted neuraminidase
MSSTGNHSILFSKFIYEAAPFPACHASTIAQTNNGLIAAFFGRTRERDPDVCIYVSLNRGGKWLPPARVACGVESGARLPCWNPVLYQPTKGPLILFYKVGPSPSTWWGMMCTSEDEGATWSTPSRLPERILGPIKNKPVELSDGTMVCPSSTENGGWRVHMELTRDLGRTWTKTHSLNEDNVQLIQPMILDHGGRRLQILCRSKQKRIYQSWSTDAGQTWSPPEPTALPNPNCGIDAVKLRDGRSLLVYNHTEAGRCPINIAISPDGRSWKMAFSLEDGQPEFSYPAVIQSDDGLVHITYTWNRQRIRYVVVDPAKIP